MPKKKASGPDGIPIEDTEEVFIADKNLFTSRLTICLKNGYFPKVWKIPNVVLFNKGKNKEDPSSYHPIGLLNSWSKILDCLLAQRIQYYNHQKNWLSVNYGFPLANEQHMS